MGAHPPAPHDTDSGPRLYRAQDEDGGMSGASIVMRRGVAASGNGA